MTSETVVVELGREEAEQLCDRAARSPKINRAIRRRAEAKLRAALASDSQGGERGERFGPDVYYGHIVYRLHCLLHGRERPTLEEIHDEFKALRDGTGETLERLVAQGRCEECGTLQGLWHKLGCSNDAAFLRDLASAPPEDSGERRVVFEVLKELRVELEDEAEKARIERDYQQNNENAYTALHHRSETLEVAAALVAEKEAELREDGPPPSPPEPQALEGEKHPAEISWCHTHRVAREGSGCARCLEQTGGYTTHVYVPAESATRIAELEAAVSQHEATVERWKHAQRKDAYDFKQSRKRLEEAVERAVKRADLLQARLEEVRAQRDDYKQRLVSALTEKGQAEAVLDESAAELQRRADDADRRWETRRPGWERDRARGEHRAHRRDARLLREKQAELKGGRG